MKPKIEPEVLKGFLAELDALSAKYKIGICGCGCCGSPQLYPMVGDGAYLADYVYAVRVDVDDDDYEYTELHKKAPK